MARAYTSEFAGVSITAVQDLVSLQTTSAMVAEIDEFTVGQITSATIGNLRVSMNRFSGAYSIGSAGSSVTPRPHVFGDSAAVCTTRTNDTTQTNSGTKVVLPVPVYNVINGLTYQPPREDRIVVAISQAFVASLDTAPAAGETSSGYLTFREVM